MIKSLLPLILLLCSAGYAWPEENTLPDHSLAQEKPAMFPADMGLSGSFRIDYFSSDRNLDSQSDFVGSTVSVKLLPKLGEYISGKVEARVTDPDISTGRGADQRLLEGYGTLHLGQADIRAGRQIVVWGRADKVNPTDNLTPRDYTVLLPFDEDQRRGIVALKADYYLTNEHTLILFATPFFEPTKIPMAIPSNTVLADRIPSRTGKNTEIGLKLDKSGEGLDWSAGYYHGFSLLPEIRFNSVLSDGNTLLDMQYPEMDVIGADMARNYGHYAVRGEVAYFRFDDDDTEVHPYLSYVMGADRTFMETLNINLQVVGRWVHHYTDPESIVDPTQRSLAIKNAIIHGQLNRTSIGFTSRISDKWLHETLSGEILAAINFDPVNSYTRALITYAFTDTVKGSMGGELYSGPDESSFGSLKQNSTAFAEIRYSF